MSSLDTNSLKKAVEEILGHDVFLTKSRDAHRLEYGYARVRIPRPHAFGGVFYGTSEGTSGEAELIVPMGIGTWFDVVVKQCAGILSTGRTVECGSGIGVSDWAFVLHGQPCDTSWSSLLENVEGISGKVRDEAWCLSPDYQRGSVWSKDQQERFVGHCLAGGEVPSIYIQRYDGPDNAPKGSDYLSLPLEVIDGQQRIRAIIAFLKGECGAQVFHSNGWHLYQYAEMNETERRVTRLSSKVVFVDLSREDRLRFYLRLNSGIAHTTAELDRVRRMLVTESGEE